MHEQRQQLDVVVHVVQVSRAAAVGDSFAAVKSRWHRARKDRL
jgi:hypothetical protein